MPQKTGFIAGKWRAFGLALIFQNDPGCRSRDEVRAQ